MRTDVPGFSHDEKGLVISDRQSERWFESGNGPLHGNETLPRCVTNHVDTRPVTCDVSSTFSLPIAFRYEDDGALLPCKSYNYLILISRVKQRKQESLLL